MYTLVLISVEIIVRDRGRGEEEQLGKKGEWCGLGTAKIVEGDGGSGRGLRRAHDGGSGDGSHRGCATRQQNPCHHRR
jgi:hypothetical protein